MSNSAVLTLIDTFTKDELKKFRAFLNSPYFNQNINVNMLFEFMLSLDENERKTLSNEIVHDNIFAGRKFNNENVKTIIYLLNRACEKFLVVHSMESNEADYNNRLLSIFDKRGLDKHFTKLHRQIEKNSSGGSKVELNAIYRQGEYERTLIEYFTRKNYETEVFKHEQKLSGMLIAAFLVDTFKQYNIFWRTGYLDYVKIDEFTTALLGTIDLEKLFWIFEERGYPYKDLLVPYFNIYRLLNDETNSMNVMKIKESIVSNTTITENEKFILSTILVNTIYYKNLNSGNLFNRELFEAFKLLLELYKHSGELHLRYTIFSNVLRIGLQLGEFEWTENFIKNSHMLLEPGIKENMYYYSSAYLSFAKGEFDKCLEFESKINFETFQQRYYLRDLRLCSLYELGQFESALNLIDSYKHFIKNDKSYTPKMKQGYIQFLGFINDLVRLKLGTSRKKMADLSSKLAGSSRGSGRVLSRCAGSGPGAH